MFSMGRFDPRMEEMAEKKPHLSSAKKNKKDINAKRESLDKKDVHAEMDQVENDGKEHILGHDESGYKSTGGSSSSAPSSDGSSSSAPSSDEEDDEDDNGKEEDSEEPILKVIAPEQKYSGVGTKRKRRNITDEGMDDFDQDQEESCTQEVKNALKVSNLPIRDAARMWNLAPFLIQNLEEDEYDSFFPIQALVIPDVIASERHAHIRNRDICVSAPTGSGKTLAFVLPVLNSLAGRRVKRLRALVVLPSRDLATQVYKVFDRYSKGSDLSIGLSIGQTDFAAEQSSLVIGDEKIGESNASRRFRYALDPFSVENALHAFNGVKDGEYLPKSGCWTHGDLKKQGSLCATPNGGSSAVDVLVCTPGRLMAHLESTPGFTLQHLRYLVCDEADRLLNQSYQNWIHRVVEAASVGPKRLLSNLRDCSVDGSNTIDPVTWRRDQGGVDQTTDAQRDNLDTSVCRPVQLRKLLFSATMTKDPRKLASLGLINPKHFDAHHLNEQTKLPGQIGTGQASYSLPETLRESIVECTAEQKPLVLLAFLLEQSSIDDENNQQGIAIVFTSSVDSTHRLARLLQLLYAKANYGETNSVAEFSSALTQKQRSNLMSQCNNESNDSSRIRVIVCSDGMSRGMDIQSVTAVINYDVPSFAKTYVHRCGRTARARRSGNAVTIMKSGQVGKFMKMRELIDNPDNVLKAGIKKDLVKDAVPIYKKCVRALRKVLEAEENKELTLVEPLGSEWVK